MTVNKIVVNIQNLKFHKNFVGLAVEGGLFVSQAGSLWQRL
jgi:hypothetical protein